MTDPVKYSPELISEVADMLQLSIRAKQFSYAEFCDEINHLIITNFNALVNILYRLDVSEHKINDALAGQPGEDAAVLIADLILDRQVEKIKTRKQFNNSEDIPEDERW